MKVLHSTCRFVCALLFGCLITTSHFAIGGELPRPTVILLTTSPTASESGSENGQFLVVRTGPTTDPLTVFYTLSGSAQNGVDYDTLPGQVTIPAGDSFAPVSITAIDDQLVEGNEFVVATLNEGPYASPIPPYVICWPQRGVVTIIDNDKVENDPPHVAITNPPNGAVIPGPTDIVLTARAWDLDGHIESVEFFANGQSIGVANNWLPLRQAALSAEKGPSDQIATLGSDLYPGLEVQRFDGTDVEILPHNAFRLKWDDVPAGDYELVAVATDNDGASTKSAPIKITVLPPPPQTIVNVVARDPIASEGGSTATDPTLPAVQDTATFVIRRTGPTDRPLDVFYKLTGTAENGADFVELPTMVTIPEGSSFAKVVVEPIDDTLVEGPETVVLSLVEPVCPAVFPPPPECYLVGRHGRARAVIRDNDQPIDNLPPRVVIVRPDDGSIFRTPADVTIVADAHDRDGHVVSVEFFDGEESLGVVMNPPLLLRPLGDTGATEPVLQPFVFTWQNVPIGDHVLRTLATDDGGATTWSCPIEIKVVDVQRPPVVTINTIDGDAREQSPLIDAVPDTARFQVQRNGSTEHALKVFYRVGGTAENGKDYQPLRGSVVIPVGEKTADIVVDPIDDNLTEGDESVIIRLVPLNIDVLADAQPLDLPPYIVGDPSIARAIIHDNEPPPANQPPKVALIAPLDGSIFVRGDDIRLVAEAGDRDGHVTQVEFFANGESVGVVPALDSSTTDVSDHLFRLAWPKVPIVMYELSAVATDDDGATAASQPIQIKVIDPCNGTHVWISAIDPIATEPQVWPPGVMAPIMAPDTATIRINRRACDVSAPLEVHYKIGGTAENGVDYQALDGLAIIPADAWHIDITILPLDDKLVEGTESVVLALQPPPCLPDDTGAMSPGRWVVEGSGEAAAFIRDNDSAENQFPKVAITQPADGASFPLHSPIEIDATALDPDGWVPKVEFFANGVKIGEQQIVFIREPDPGQQQSFSFVWDNAEAGDYTLVARAIDDKGAMSKSEPVHIKVIDEYPISKVVVLATDPIASEGATDWNTADSAPHTATFRVYRTERNDLPLEVYYHLGGTAENGVDYQQLSGHVTIPTGEWSAPVVVDPVDDQIVEGIETVVLELAPVACPAIWPPSPDCYEIGWPSRAVAFIRDNDQDANRRPKITLTQPMNGDTFDAPTSIDIRARAKDPDGWVRLVEFYDGHEKIGEVPMNFIQEPPPGQEQVFEFTWSQAPLGGHVLTAVATDNHGAKSVSDPVEIKVVSPDGPPVVTIHTRDPYAHEGGPNGAPNIARFRVKRTGATDSDLTVYYQIDGSATNGKDYQELSGVVTIPAGRHSAPIVINPIDDDLAERIETVILKLVVPPSMANVSIANTPPYIVGRPGRAVGYILDNDRPRPNCIELPNGMVSLCLGGKEGVSYAIEVSTDLKHWQRVDTNTVRNGGQLDYVDPDAATHDQRFYRIVEAPDDLRIEEELP
ncbi:hypothetical protein GC207_06595 [bacterium]|nr:hypothetical protein [bacterium]